MKNPEENIACAILRAWTTDPGIGWPEMIWCGETTL